MLVWLTGASGSGKSTIARALGETGRCSVLHFDSIGVPSSAEMERGWGSGENWQRAMTFRWMERIASMPAGQTQVMDGQARPAFVIEASERHGVDVTTVLIDCERAERERRLCGRDSVELCTDDMEAWAQWLLCDARERGLAIVDTTATTVGGAVAAVDQILAEIELLR